MKKLSEIIYEKEFKPGKAGGFLRGDAGYDSARVDLFLEEIGPMAENLEKEKVALEEKVKELQEQLQLKASATESAEAEATSENTDLDSFYESVNQDEELRRRWRQIETLERSNRKILLIAEEQAEGIREEAREEAVKLISEAKQKVELLLKQVNIRCEEKEKDYAELVEKYEKVEKDLMDIVQYITSSQKNRNEAV